MLSRIVRTLRNAVAAAQPQVQPARCPMFENLEKRELMAVSPIIAGTKIKGVNLSANGVSTNQTLITIPFTGNINIADASKIQLRGYAINPLTGGQVKKVINVVKAEVLAAPNDQYLQITTDCLMRKGGQIILLEGALTDDNGDLIAATTRRTVKGQNKERFTLARRGFIPTDVTKFTSTLYNGAAPNAASGTIAEATATADLTAFLQRKVDQGILTTTQRNNALTRYNATASRNIVPDHNLRAALISLVGTFAEPAIASYLDGVNQTGKAYTIVSFDNPEGEDVPVAQTVVRSDGRLRCVVKPEFRGEDFRALSCFLAHEALHQDSQTGLQEEMIATAVETLVYGQQAIVDSTFLADNTNLVNFENERLMALIQSGRTIFPYVGLFNGPNRNATGNVFPSAKAQTGGNYVSYENFILRHYQARGAVSQTTPGNALLRQYFTAITTKAAPANQNFSGSILTEFDAFQAPIGTAAAVKLAGALRLGIV